MYYLYPKLKKKNFMSGIYRLKGVVKHYDWGGTTFIPSLLSIDNKENRPFAEYWMGTHPLGVSLVETNDGKLEKLTDIAGDLPFLFKAQQVKEMLSIQAHPSKAAAAIEFARENKEDIPLDSPIRNYKDDNHKPEMLVALGDFYLLHGFKPERELIQILEAIPELNGLLPVYKKSGYKGLYELVMTMPQEEVNKSLQPLVDRIVPLYKENKLAKTDENFWAARAALTFTKDNNIDRGIFSIYLFNLLHLEKGEGLFQGAGVPHAYLEGFNVELMANSDNVLRGGLTPKHVDVKELLKHVKCEATIPHVIAGYQFGKNKKVYHTPAPDFQLSVFELEAGDTVSFTPITTEILLLTDGDAIITNGMKTVGLLKGNPSAVVFPGQDIRLVANAKATVFRASLPVNSGE
jgi:mannose-6-phosphate isomerase